MGRRTGGAGAGRGRHGENTTKRYGDYNAAAPQSGTANQFWVAGEIGGTSGTSFKWNTAAGPVTAS